MDKKEDENAKIFPASPDKTYGLMAVVRGVSPVIEKEPEDTVFTYPNLIIKEAICFLLIIIVIAVISLLFNAPLEELANPSKTPNPAKAPWYFLSLQELLHYFPPVIAGVFIPTAAVGLAIILPYIDIHREGMGEWFSPKRKIALTLFSIFIITVVVLTAIGLFFRGPSWMWVWPWE